ncbi:hypothetical protein [Nocardia testacea]|uniref:hypothetical protein n=1 Tax=Nocardia testacea TaxID=248551 RepID=UPI003A839B76
MTGNLSRKAVETARSLAESIKKASKAISRLSRLNESLVQSGKYLRRTDVDLGDEIRRTCRRMEDIDEFRVSVEVSPDRPTASSDGDVWGDLANAGESNESASYDPADAVRLMRQVAGLPLPFHINTACGLRAEAMLSALRHLGVPADALGIARSFAPDLSADGLEHGYAIGAVMKKDRHATPSFTQRMYTGVGHVDSSTSTVNFEGVRFTETHVGQQRVIMLGPEHGGQEWRFQAPGEEQPFCNHTAPTIRMSAIDGQEAIGVIDPTYDSTRPLSLQEWAARQNYPDVVVMTGNLADTPGTPFRIHTELMTDSQRARFEAISRLHGSSYEEVVSEFFNLQSADPYRESRGRENPADQYTYARVLASTIRDGNLLPAKIDASGQTASEVVERLKPVATYQRWLDATGGIP